VDFAEVMLDILMGKRDEEEQGGDGGADGNKIEIRSVQDEIRDLTHLQLQLSDFEFHFSTKRPSVVAFASVINAIRMKQSKLLSSLSSDHGGGNGNPREALASKVQALAAYFDRAELESTIDELRVLVDVDIEVDVDVGVCCGCSRPHCVYCSVIPPPPSPHSHFPLEEESPTSSAAMLDRPDSRKWQSRHHHQDHDHHHHLRPIPLLIIMIIMQMPVPRATSSARRITIKIKFLYNITTNKKKKMKKKFKTHSKRHLTWHSLFYAAALLHTRPTPPPPSTTTTTT